MATVFFDIDTQIDFLMPAGALYVPGAERIIPLLAALNRHAAAQGIPQVSTADAHAENDPEFRSWPAHCVAGTLGQRKPDATLAPGQILFEKVTLNAFDDPRFPALLERLDARRCVVYGVVTEVCVRHAAMGMLASGRRVEIVADAVKELSAPNKDSFLAAFTAAGGVLTSSASILT